MRWMWCGIGSEACFTPGGKLFSDQIAPTLVADTMSVCLQVEVSFTLGSRRNLSNLEFRIGRNVVLSAQRLDSSEVRNHVSPPSNFASANSRNLTKLQPRNRSSFLPFLPQFSLDFAKNDDCIRIRSGSTDRDTSRFDRVQLHLRSRTNVSHFR